MKSNTLLHLLFISFFLFCTKDIQALYIPTHIPEQQAPNPIKKIVKAIEKANVFVLNMPELPSPLVTDLEKNYLLLSRLATSNELEDLILTNRNGAVRMYAFKALTMQLHHIPENIMTVIKNDTTLVDCINKDKSEKAEIKNLVQNFLN